MINPFTPDFTCTPASANRPRFGYQPDNPEAEPFATIVTPFYNTGPVFRETACSVLGQSLQQWEWLIINDASSDPQALELLEEYRHRDPRIRVIDHPDNRGLSAARNTGYRAARAPHVVQLDSDDLLEPTAIEKWCWYLESHPHRAFVKGYTVQFGASELLWCRGFHEPVVFLEQNLVNPTSAVRKCVHEAVEGFDEADRGGLMDWDFWLRCANAGYWGGTIPEYLDWYRRRPSHNDLWPDFDNGVRQQAYARRLQEKYPRLWSDGFPDAGCHGAKTRGFLDELPCANRLRRGPRRLLLLTAWMCLGGADRFNLELLGELTRQGWEVSIATTLAGDHSWLPHYAAFTPDIFVLHHFLSPEDYPRFLRYLIASRQYDVVMTTHSELAYSLLPYLRAHAPDVTYVDYCHIEEEHWKRGGYPRMSVDAQEFLDLSIVSSQHLKEWMTDRGADANRIRVCYTNIDADQWRPDAAERKDGRRELSLDESTNVILFAGRLHAQKQPRVLAETFHRLHQQRVPFVALVAGDGPDRLWMEGFLVRRGLQPYVWMLGEVSCKRLQQLMRLADVFFLPSQWEGIALTLFEAMASGLPIVAADVGGQRELVTPDCGVLIERNKEAMEIEQYTEVLGSLLRDPCRRRELGAAARQRVATHFRREAMSERMLAYLEEADQIRQTQPRPEVNLPLARRCAAQAVELIQLTQWTAAQWANQNGAVQHVRTYRVLSRLASPAYRLAARRGWTWFFPLGEKVKRLLFFPE